MPWPVSRQLVDEPGPTGRPDGQTPLTVSVLNALDRPPLPAIVPGTFSTVVLGLLTAGLLPAITLARGWLDALRWHRRLFWHLAEWTGVEVGREEGKRLHEINEVRAPRILAIIALCLALAGVFVVLAGVFLGREWWTFWVADPVRQGRADPWTGLHLACLGGSFVLTWLSINLHLGRLRRIDAALAEMTSGLGTMGGKRPPTWIWGFGPIATVVSAILAMAGLLWAVPMLMASTAARQMLVVHHRRLRGRVAGRVREMLSTRRPFKPLPPVVDRVLRCSNPLCDEPVPPDARHCPRCGTQQRPVTRLLD